MTIGNTRSTLIKTSRKGISKIPGVSNVQVTTSGRPNVGSGAFSGGEIFGILFGVVVALVIANFAYKVGIYFLNYNHFKK